MATPQFQLPSSFQGHVRLFPLPNLVMFPHNVLPLHIFESRYREMLEDAARGDQLITMATLKPGFEPEYYSRPPVSPAVCIGRVTAYEENQQGTYNLRLVGLKRANIQDEIEPVRSFRRATVGLLEDRCDRADETHAARFGRELVDRIRHNFPSAEELVEAFSRRNISLAALTDILAFHLQLDIGLKLQLLGEVNVSTRAKLLLANLPTERPAQSTKNPFPPKFSAN